MRLTRRGVVRGLTAVLVAAAAATDASAQDAYPSRPISLILPYAAGGGTDAVARVFAKALEEKRGADFGAFMAAERRRWGEVVRDAKITLKE